MATYKELFDLRNNSDLQDRVTTAIAIAAQTIMDEDPGTTNHANRLLWAKGALENPLAKRAAMLGAVLAANAGASVAQIQGATDAAIQSNVDGAVDLFATGA